MTVCNKCNLNKPHTEYRQDKPSNVCKSCSYEANKEWVNNNKDRRKKQQSKANRRAYYRHCVNYEDYKNIWDDVTHCQCCGAEFDSEVKRLTKCMDHVDAGPNSYVRGIICGNCNIGIGCLGDTFDGVFNAINYLDREVCR